MQTNIIQIGNSKGIILPSELLRKLRLSLKSSVIIEDDNGSIVIKPSPRQGWAEAAQKMAVAGDDTILMPNSFKDENLDWWEWK
jgi:antitoxin MazE